MSTGYRCILWQCPYFRWDKKYECHCEGGVLRFSDGQTYLNYIHTYCAGSWQKCTLARALGEQYEKGDEI